MKSLVEEWVAKAESDYATAGRELQAVANPNYDAVCFHAQQCAEKLMKALLIHLGSIPPKTHDLVALDRLLVPLTADWSWPLEELRFLTRASVDYRYPGESADYEEAAESFRIVMHLRERLKLLIGSS